MTGFHAGHAFIRDNLEMKPEGQYPIPADTVTFAQLLKAQGYATGAMGKWGLGPVGSTGDPNKHGFDLFSATTARLKRTTTTRYTSGATTQRLCWTGSSIRTT